jgi:acyl-CoA thioesterase-1
MPLITLTFQLFCAALLVFVPTTTVFSQPSALAILGSSTAAGTGASQPNQSWAALLQSWLVSTKNTTVVNLAEPGALTSSATCPPNGTAQFVTPSKKSMSQALKQGATKIILSFPSNDTTHGLNAEQTVKNILDLRQCAKKNNALVAVMSSLPRSGLTEQQNITINQIDSMLSKEFGSCFIQVRSALADNSQLSAKREYALGDGVHFNDAGHKAIFNLVKTFIERGQCF